MALATTSGRDGFDSISEGCFLIIPAAQRKERTTVARKSKRSVQDTTITKRQRVNTDTSITHGGFQQLFNGEESEQCMLLRKRVFDTTWNKTKRIIDDILLDMNRAALNEIKEFVDNAHCALHDSSRLIALPYNEIPTGLVFAGINTPDHDAQFSQIAASLLNPPLFQMEQRQRNFVTLLQSKDCSTLRGMMKNMVDRFLEFSAQDTMEPWSRAEDHNDDEEEIESDSEEAARKAAERAAGPYRLGAQPSTKASRLSGYDLQILEAWYTHTAKHQADKSAPNPNLVVILQDFEAFEPTIIQDFIAICSEYRQRIPLVFIIGIATSTEILHQSLSKSTLGLLRIEKFWLQQNDVWFNRVLEKIFLDTHDTLKFGARPYKFLLDHFFLFDFSMGKVTASLKYALMHHFYGNPLSIFWQFMSDTKEDAEARVADLYEANILNAHHATNLRMLPSFRDYINAICKEAPKRALQLLDDDRFLLSKALPGFLQDIITYQIEFKLGIELIILLQTQFPNLSGFKRKTPRILLLEALETRDSLGEKSEECKWLVSLVRKMGPEPLGELVQRIRHLVTDKEYGSINEEALESVDEWEERLQALDDADDTYTSRMEKKAKRLAGMVLPEMDGGRHTETAKKVQLESIDHLKKKGTEASKIAMDTADWCARVFEHYLRSYTGLPMHELVYYTNVKLHEKSFAAQPRAAVQTALSQSQHYINCECCTNEDREHISPTEHDACILYKLYLECGRMINLYDWFVAFGCIIEREKRPGGRKLEEGEVQARFIRSVAELQFLGFIKPTQRKTDHVMRLTWSNM